MRVVLDTGILIAALIMKDTPQDRLYQSWRKKRFTLITSEWQLGEFRRVSRHPKLPAFLKPHEAGTMVNGLRRNGVMLSQLPKVETCRDPDDNPILGMALAGGADFVVAGDKQDLLSLKKLKGTPIVTARKLADVLDLKTGRIS